MSEWRFDWVGRRQFGKPMGCEGEAVTAVASQGCWV